MLSYIIKLDDVQYPSIHPHGAAKDVIAGSRWCEDDDVHWLVDVRLYPQAWNHEDRAAASARAVNFQTHWTTSAYSVLTARRVERRGTRELHTNERRRPIE